MRVYIILFTIHKQVFVKQTNAYVYIYISIFLITVVLIVIHHVHHVMDHQNHNVSCVVPTDFPTKVNVSTLVQMAILAIKSVRSACNVLLDVPLVAATHVWHVKRTGWRTKRTNVLPTAAVIAMNVSNIEHFYTFIT